MRQANLRERLGRLHRFLDGRGEIEGLYFGDPSPVSGRPLWWRVHLPVIQEASDRITALEAEVEGLREASKPKDFHGRLYAVCSDGSRREVVALQEIAITKAEGLR